MTELQNRLTVLDTFTISLSELIMMVDNKQIILNYPEKSIDTINGVITIEDFENSILNKNTFAFLIREDGKYEIEKGLTEILILKQYIKGDLLIKYKDHIEDYTKLSVLDKIKALSKRTTMTILTKKI